MNISLRTKLLVLCIVLVLLATAGMAVTYYKLTTANAYRESRQRLQIAFSILLNDFEIRRQRLAELFNDFLDKNLKLQSVAVNYQKMENRLASRQFVIAELGQKVAKELLNFGRVAQVEHLSFYAGDGRLLVVYRHEGNAETVGGYVISESGQNSYLPMDNFNELMKTLSGRAIPDAPLPEGVMPSYDAEIPDKASAEWFTKNGRVGILVSAPLIYKNEKVGVVVGQTFYDEEMVGALSALSKTSLNLFAGTQRYAGTLPEQERLDVESLDFLAPCELLTSSAEEIELLPLTFSDRAYYQAQCTLNNTSGDIGALSASFPQEIEKSQIRGMLMSVLSISAIVSTLAIVSFFLFSRKLMLSVQNIVEVMGAASEGDLRNDARKMTNDEIGLLAQHLNLMLAQLRTISSQVQGASSTVNSTADTIFQQMEDLIRHIEQQAGSVDNMTISVENINGFIDLVAQNSYELLSTVDQSLAAVQETRASVNEVSSSTSQLTTNLQQILSTVDQSKQTVRQISEHTEFLSDAAEQTGSEIQHIDRLLTDVSKNAGQTEQLAQKTMDAATTAETSVEASLQGMTELMQTVSALSHIIQEVSARSDRVSSILDIVDEITGQTALLSLNASIISAQAGVHGRGFAVVAEEIKELATRTAVSTKEIGTLIHELHQKTEEGVQNTFDGLAKAEHSVSLSNAVKEALATILEHATHSSTRASNTSELLVQATSSSQAITTSMQSVTEMAANIRRAILEHQQDIGRIVEAVERISGLSKEVSRAGVEQTRAASEIESSMQLMTDRFGDISSQTKELRQNSQQIVDGMHVIDNTTSQILENVTTISGNFVKNLVKQADMLEQTVKVFKIS